MTMSSNLLLENEVKGVLQVPRTPADSKRKDNNFQTEFIKTTVSGVGFEETPTYVEMNPELRRKACYP